MSDLPVCGFDDILTAGKDLEHAARDFLTEYLKAFAKPILPPATPHSVGQSVVLCLKCEKPLMGMIGTFVWGIAHGEGFCSSCHWPVRLYHLLKLPGVEGEQRLVFPLCYHPSLVESQPTTVDEEVSL